MPLRRAGDLRRRSLILGRLTGHSPLPRGGRLPSPWPRPGHGSAQTFWRAGKPGQARGFGAASGGWEWDPILGAALVASVTPRSQGRSEGEPAIAPRPTHPARTPDAELPLSGEGRDAPPPPSVTKFGNAHGAGTLAQGPCRGAAAPSTAPRARPGVLEGGEGLRGVPRVPSSSSRRVSEPSPRQDRARCGGSPSPTSVSVACYFFSSYVWVFSWSCFIGIPVIKSWCSLGALMWPAAWAGSSCSLLPPRLGQGLSPGAPHRIPRVPLPSLAH